MSDQKSSPASDEEQKSQRLVARSILKQISKSKRKKKHSRFTDINMDCEVNLVNIIQNKRQLDYQGKTNKFNKDYFHTNISIFMQCTSQRETSYKNLILSNIT